MTDKIAAASRLLDRDVPADSLQESTVGIALKKDLLDRGTKSVVIFRIGVEWLALPTSVVQEVSDHATVRTMPDRRGGILSGVVNVRGELLLCIALGVLLGLDQVTHKPAAEQRTSAERLLICKGDDGRLAFQVSEVHGLHRYLPKDLKEAPATLTRASGGAYVLGVVPWKDRMVGCLDDQLMFYALSKALA